MTKVKINNTLKLSTSDDVAKITEILIRNKYFVKAKYVEVKKSIIEPDRNYFEIEYERSGEA